MLLAAGHVHVDLYPIGLLGEEAKIVEVRRELHLAQMIDLQQLVIATAPVEMSKTAQGFARKSYKALMKRLGQMTGDQ